jgi:hypothetical protein
MPSADGEAALDALETLAEQAPASGTPWPSDFWRGAGPWWSKIRPQAIFTKRHWIVSARFRGAPRWYGLTLSLGKGYAAEDEGRGARATPAPPSRSSTPWELTSREMQIARLAAQRAAAGRSPANSSSEPHSGLSPSQGIPKARCHLQARPPRGASRKREPVGVAVHDVPAGGPDGTVLTQAEVETNRLSN